MLIVDDILAAPIKGVVWILKKVAAAADQELLAEAERIKERLRELYLQLEQKQITEADFDAHEGPLLDRLDEIERPEEDVADEDEGEDEDEDAEDEGDEDEDEDDGDEDEDDGDDEEDEDEDEEEDDDSDDDDSDDDDSDDDDSDDDDDSEEVAHD
jgi:hypothetical protein